MIKLKFGVLPLAQHPSGEDCAQKYNEMVEQAILLEKYGFSSIWLVEHHVSEDNFFPPFVTLAGLASHTKKLKIGTGTVILPFHYPLRIAEDVAMLDVLSGGRMILGASIGYRREEFTGFRIPYSARTSMLEEQIPLLRRLWSEPRVTHRGKHFTLVDASVNPKPVQRNLPIWIGASGAAPKEALERMARLGDAWFADQSTPLSKHKEVFAIYRQMLKKYGKDFSRIEVPLLREVYIAKDLDTARKDVEMQMVGKYRLYFRWNLPILKMCYDREEDITFESLLKDTIIIGSPDECIGQIEKYGKELGVNHMVFRIQFKGFSHKKTVEAMKLFGEKVIPYFAAKSK